MTEGTGRVCVVGSLNIDTTYFVPNIPSAGETVLAEGKVIAPGGKGANQAVAAATMGSRVTMVGCVGDDPEAEIATAALLSGGVDVSHLIRVTDAATGTAVLFVDGRGENVIAVDPGANQRLDPALITEHLAQSSYDAVLAQLEVNLPAVLTAARNRGSATFILNPAPMTSDEATLSQILEATDVVVPNRLELARLAGRPVPTTRDELDQCVASLDFDGIVVVTLGSAGAAVYDRGRPRRAVFADGVAVQSLDTTGAGDVFCGVLGHYLAVRADIALAVRRANEVAALSTTVRGARIQPTLLTAPGRPPASGMPAQLS